MKPSRGRGEISRARAAAHLPMVDPRADADPQAEIRFVLDGDVVRVRDVPPQTTVLEYLREHLGRTGTKEGCAEGDCGACTVVVASCDTSGDGASDDALSWHAVNACIRPLPTLDGKALFTVESLRGRRRLAASRAGGDGGVSCLAVRILHSRLRDVAVRPLQARAGADACADRRRLVGKPLSLHRIPSDHRRRAPHGRAGSRNGLARSRDGRGRSAHGQR